MTRVVLVDYSPPWIPVLAEKTSAGMVARKGLGYYLSWQERHGQKDLCKHLVRAAKNYPVVLEHVKLTFYIEGCSRVCSHQLVRHRLATYTQESQRYSVLECRPENIEDCIVTPKSIREAGLEDEYLELAGRALQFYLTAVGRGVPAEDARFILPQAVKTRLLMTVNLRELLHIIKLRTQPAAQWEIREVAEKLKAEASRVIPCIEDMIRVYSE